VFVLLFFAGGGPIGEDAVMLGSSAPTEDGGAPDGPDIANAAVTAPDPDARLLFRALVGDEESCFKEASAPVGCVRAGEIADTVSNSCLSTRLDIGDKSRDEV